MSMREKYQSLALADLKAIARSRGIKGTSAMKKADVVEAMVALDEQESHAKTETAAASDTTQKPARTVKSPQNQEEKAERRGPASGGQHTAGASGQGRGQERRPVRRYNPGQQESSFVASPSGSYGAGSGAGSSGAGSNNNGSNNNGSNNNSSNNNGSYSNSNGVGGSNSANSRNAGNNSSSNSSNSNTGNSTNGNSANSTSAGSTPSGGNDEERFPAGLDSGISANGILEVMPDGYGFIRCANYLPGENDVYVAPSQIRRFGLKTGDIVVGNTRVKTQNEKFSALLYVKSINGYAPDVASRRKNFEDMTPIFPDKRIRLEMSSSSVAMRIMDLMSPVGKGQRGMIVSPPKAGKTTLLKQVAQSVKTNHPDMHLIILLIDERPEEVTDFREAIEGPNVEVIYSTFDELPEHHKRVSEMVIERAKRLVEHKKDVMILLDSITRLTRAYNLVIPPSGRTLSGGLDPAALHMPKRFFGAARNMREGGSLTILATALVDTGSRMDDVIYEEFKGTGNMEIVLDRKLSERRVFPAIDIPKSGTRREDLLLSAEELEAIGVLRKALNGMKPEESVDKILDMFTRTRNNVDFVNIVKKMKFI